MARKMDWFRLYPEVRRDPKIRRLDPEERWLWITLLCIASDSPKRGHLLISEGFPYESADIADEAALPLDVTEQGLDKFMKFGLLEREEDGVYYLPKWDDRQYDNPSDTPEATRERQRRSRAKRKKSREGKRKVTNEENTNHDHVTSVSRPSHETESDTESETDTTAATARAREGQSEENDGEQGYESFYAAHKRVFGFECNPFQTEQLGKYIDEDGMHETVVIRAMERAAINGQAYSFNLILKIVNDYFHAGVKTIDQAAAFDNEFDKRRKLRGADWERNRNDPGADSANSSEGYYEQYGVVQRL